MRLLAMLIGASVGGRFFVVYRRRYGALVCRRLKLPWPDVRAGRESNALRRFVFTEEVAQILRTACDYVSSITTFLPG